MALYQLARLFLCAGLTGGAALPAAATEFWLGERDPIVQQGGHHQYPVDYVQLFAPDAPWQQAASRLTVFKVSTQLILFASDDLIRAAFQTMQRRHIPVAVEIGMVPAGTDCGGGEGYANPGMVDRVGAHLQRLGLRLDYMAMDEPVWMAHERSWGRSFKGLPDCQYTLDAVAQGVAQNVAAMRRYYPAVRVGEIEVVGTRLDPRRVFADYGTFARLFERYTGTPLAFFHADVVWQNDWQPLIAPLKRQVHALGLRFGVIIDGDLDNDTDQAWVDAGLQRLQMMAANPAMTPDDVIVQSWQPLPSHILPDSSPGTTTYMLRQAEAIMH
jgi:hypothetical protein